MRVRFLSGAIFILLAFCYSGQALASSGKISGVVTDAESGEPLPGANIVIQGVWRNGQIIPLQHLQGAATDMDGYYFIINIQPEVYAIKASMMGYESKQVVGVKVDFNRTITLDFALRPTIIQGQEVTVTAKKEVVQLDVSSSQLTVTRQESENMPVTDIQEVLNLSPGVSVNTFNNQISIRGGGSDQVMTYLDGFALKDQIFNVPFLSYNRTSIKEITIQTGGFSAEYGDLRSGMIDVVTESGGSQYSLSIDSRYAPPRYKYDGPKRYIEDKNFLIYGSDWSMDSTILAQKFPWWEDKFVGWPVFSKGYLTDTDSTNDMTPNQRRELWKWRHRGRPEGQRPDYTIDGTFSGPMPGASLPLIGPALANMNFMVSYRNKYYAYEHPAERDHFAEDNAMLKLTYRITPTMNLTFMGMQSTQSGMTFFDDNYGATAYIQRTNGGGWYNDTNNPIGDVITRNFGVSFVHTLSPNTFYEIRANRVSTEYDFRHGHERDSTLIKHIPGEFYVVEDDSMFVHGFWLDSNEYIRKDTVLLRGDKMWCPDIWENETANGWPEGGAGNSYYDQPGKFDLNAASTSSDASKGYSTTIRGDLTHQAGKYHLMKMGFYYNGSLIDRYWYKMTNVIYDEWHEVKFKAHPRYYAAYFQDRIEVKGLIGNFGVRTEVFDANEKVLSPDDPFNEHFFGTDFWTRQDSLDKAAAEKYIRISPRLGISHPMTASSKIFFNYGHAYSSPVNAYRFGWRPKTYNWSRPQWIGNPNLKPYKTVQYELGYEQVLFKDYLIHTSIYYKDVTDQVGDRVQYFMPNTSNTQAYYFTWDNNNYEDIIGWEFRLYKRVGRFLTGWLQTEFIGQKSGMIGYIQRYTEDDPNNTSTFAKYSYPDDIMWDWVPAFTANVDVHTPLGWGPKILGAKLLGGWRINAIIIWREGSKFTWNPTKNPYVRNNMQWANYFSNDYYISRIFKIGNVRSTLYLDVHNLFNRHLLNVSVLDGLSTNPGSEIYRYYDSLRDGDRVGHYKASHIVKPAEKPGENYIYRVGGIRRISLGLKFDFNW